VGAPPHQVRQPDGEHAQQGHGNAGRDEKKSGIGKRRFRKLLDACVGTGSEPASDYGSVDQRQQIDGGRARMAEPFGVERPVGEQLERLDHEDRLVGIVQAGQAEPDVVETPRQRNEQNDCEGAISGATP
jgi:hypothetical protein